MDCAGNELGRIVAFVNRRPWIMEDSSSCPTMVDAGLDGGSSSTNTLVMKQAPTPLASNYFLDKIGLTTFGDTSLHRISAWPVTPDQFEAFLYHMDAHAKRNGTFDSIMHYADDGAPNTLLSSKNDQLSYGGLPAPPRIDQTNQKGVTALHMVVYRNSYHAYSIVQQLLRRRKDLASVPMSCGSYPLHILCGQNVTIRKELLAELLEADPLVVWKEDVNGDTPLSLLWKNVLRFRWAHQKKVSLEDDEEDEHIILTDSMSHGISANRRLRRPSWLTVISPDQYVEYSLMLIQAALNKKTLCLADVCKMPRCPPLLVQLLLQYYDKPILTKIIHSDLLAKDQDGMSALHHAARVEPVTTKFVPAIVQERMRSLVDILLEVFPSMALMRNRSGRIAFHYALEKRRDGMPAKELYSYAAANPDSVGIRDPVTGLYPFASMAAAADVEDGAMEMVEDSSAASTFHLETIFALLRHLPEVAVYGRY